MAVFKYIFKNNNEKLVERFFNNRYILMIWDAIIKPNLTSMECFGRKGPNKKIRAAYVAVTETVNKEFTVDLPSWWKKSFSK